MTAFLSTQRLIIREMSDKDLDDLYRLNSDPDVMKYIGDGTADSLQDVKEGLERIKNYYITYPGLGIWALEDRDTKSFIGLCMLKYWSGTPEIEVGYRLLPAYWRKGYAYESAEALVKYGREKLGLKRIVATAHADNIPSVKILEKLGLRFERVETYEGRTKNFYSIGFD
jgi:RimJ/RimL family protein N-acetyltransferase